jgi:hypothetical protein
LGLTAILDPHFFQTRSLQLEVLRVWNLITSLQLAFLIREECNCKKVSK